MTQRDLFLVEAYLGGPYCGLWDVPPEVEQNYPPSAGLSDEADWPEDPSFKMEGSLPGLLVPDFINNAFRYLMVSQRVKELFEELAKDPIEWLPFKIVNHKGVTLPDRYWVANVLRKIACVDLASSAAEEDPLYPGTYERFEDLQLDYTRIPDDARVFRLAEFPSKILIRESLRAEIVRRSFTGGIFKPPVGLVE
jgi:hypothetical protein